MLSAFSPIHIPSHISDDRQALWIDSFYFPPPPLSNAAVRLLVSLLLSTLVGDQPRLSVSLSLRSLVTMGWAAEERAGEKTMMC